MFNVRLAGDHLYGKLLFTWLSLVMSMIVSFCAVFFPRDDFDEIFDLIESVSEGNLYTKSCYVVQALQMLEKGQIQNGALFLFIPLISSISRLTAFSCVVEARFYIYFDDEGITLKV